MDSNHDSLCASETFTLENQTYIGIEIDKKTDFEKLASTIFRKAKSKLKQTFLGEKKNKCS